jgi:hypothetical protein
MARMTRKLIVARDRSALFFLVEPLFNDIRFQFLCSLLRLRKVYVLFPFLTSVNSPALVTLDTICVSSRWWSLNDKIPSRFNTRCNSLSTLSASPSMWNVS